MNQVYTYYENFSNIGKKFIDINFINQPNKYRLRNMIVMFMMYAKMFTILRYIFNTLKLIPYVIYTFSFSSFTLGYMLCIYYPISKEQLSEHYMYVNNDISEKLDKYYHQGVLLTKYKYNSVCISILNSMNIDNNSKIYKFLIIQKKKSSSDTISDISEKTNTENSHSDDNSYSLRSRNRVVNSDKPSVHFESTSNDD